MKFVKIRTSASRQELIDMLSDPERTNRNVTFEDKNGTPTFHLKEKGERVSIRCEYVGGATKDNGFIDGTKFRGSIKVRGGETCVSGIITTAFAFHILLAVLFAFFIYQCISVGGFNVVPLCLLAFDIFMFYREFKKQGLIKRYIERAVKRCERENMRSASISEK